MKQITNLTKGRKILVEINTYEWIETSRKSLEEMLKRHKQIYGNYDKVSVNYKGTQTLTFIKIN